MAAVLKRRDELLAAGAGLAFVGVGTPEQAHGFRVLTGWKDALVVDADRQAYAAADLRRMGFLALFRPKMIREAMRARKEGFRQAKVQGDPWQLGGTMVLAPGDRVLYAHRSAGPEDEAPLDAVLAAVRGGRA